ncbi:MAG TPA: hypothetical protein V6D50_14615 [Chroococcales cyanobacterium]
MRQDLSIDPPTPSAPRAGAKLMGGEFSSSDRVFNQRTVIS